MSSGMASTMSASLVAVAAMTALAGQPQGDSPQHPGTTLSLAAGAIFHPATQCMTCHNGLTTPAGEDVSLGTSWRGSMMAHAARDPYWHAGVRREAIDHPKAQREIENECSRCHMPMAHVQSQARGRHQSVFANVPVPGRPTLPDPLAVDGVSCALCHQITADTLGQKASFTGGFVVDVATPVEQRRMFGPFEVDHGRSALMHSATGFRPAQGMHLQQSEVCATCHTLYTHALDSAGNPTGEFPEQMPYREWLHSDFRATQSCQSCHMPVVEQPTPIASVLGDPRDGLSRHDFRGANFVMPRLLNRFRADLGVVARPAELDDAVARSRSFLQASAATVALTRAEQVGDRLEADVLVRTLAGHKLPTGYPSRRAWLSLTVTDAHGRVLFSSGEVETNGAIAGNDNDRDGSRFEPHYQEIRSQDHVQIYEAIMGTEAGTVTTGLLSAVSYLKDNRLLPRGFDKRGAAADVAVHGAALDDPDFAGGEDRVRYSVEVSGAIAPFRVDGQLWYQPIAHRWAENLRAYDAAEPRQFVTYFDSVASSSALMLASASRTTGTGVRPHP